MAASKTQKQLWTRSMLKMGTLVSLHVATERPQREVEAAVLQAFDVFSRVEQACSRFDAESELYRLCRTVEIPVPVSPILFQALRFAMEVASVTDGVFDPAVGHTLERLGFNRHYLSGEEVQSEVAEEVSYRDIVLDEAHQTVTLCKPLQLDLGAVAKGLAVDLARQVLTMFEGFLVNAGGDLFACGLNERDEPWTVLIQHPFKRSETVAEFAVRNHAVCTSGSYERPSPVKAKTHHIVHPWTKTSPERLVSATVVAPFAMVADAFSTASFLLGLESGSAFLKDLGLDGLMIDDALNMHWTSGFESGVQRDGR